MEKILRSIGTHDGTFHADEATACALLIMFGLADEDKIIRTRDPEKLKRCDYVCDVGGIYDPARKLFDHHQAEYQGLLSSAGMILLNLYENKYLSKQEYEFFNHTLVLGIDAHDNGRDPTKIGFSSFSHVISNFTPIRYDCSETEQNQAFQTAVRFILDYLKRLHQRYLYTQSCRTKVQQAMETGKTYMIFEENIPWNESFFDLGGATHPAQFVIMPASSSGNHWKLRGIPPSYEERMKVRLLQPAEWAGLSDDELKKVCGISGAVFCHKGRFVSVWETKEDALKAVEKILGGKS